MENLEMTGEKIESVLKTMGVLCTLKNSISNDLVDKFEFVLKDLKDFSKIKKSVEIMKICFHKDIQISTSEQYHFAIEIKKEHQTLDFIEYNNKYGTADKYSAFLGMNNNGEPIIFDLKQANHTLIGGATGTGKTSILNNIIYSLSSKSTKDELQIYLIDIKKTLSMWNKLPQVAKKNIKDYCDALDVLEGVSGIMEKRFAILEKMHLSKATDDMFPRIVVIIDELADLMLSGLKKYIEQEIVHIAHIGRAVNISLIIATQNPIVKVCTSEIKANCTTRIALYTTSSSASISILENNHANKLDGIGQAIIRGAGNPKEREFKACFLTDEKIKEYLKGVKQ